MMHMRKVMKTIGICSMAAIMMAGISGCGGKTGGAVSSGAKNAAKIGFTAALTGGAAAYGKSEEEGVRLAVEEINKKGDFPIDLLVEDTKAVPADSMNATKKLIQEKVSMIIGPMTSGALCWIFVSCAEYSLSLLPKVSTSMTCTPSSSIVFWKYFCAVTCCSLSWA